METKTFKEYYKDSLKQIEKVIKEVQNDKKIKESLSFILYPLLSIKKEVEHLRETDQDNEKFYEIKCEELLGLYQNLTNQIKKIKKEEEINQKLEDLHNKNKNVTSKYK